MNAFEILNARKDRIWNRFLAMLHKPVPVVHMPDRAEDAFTMAYHMGLQTGYEQGIVDGVELGLEVGESDTEWPLILAPQEPADIC